MATDVKALYKGKQVLLVFWSCRGGKWSRQRLTDQVKATQQASFTINNRVRALCNLRQWHP